MRVVDILKVLRANGTEISAQAEEAALQMEAETDESWSDDDWDDDRAMLPDGTTFADPGGRSALRAPGPHNPSGFPCPSCKAPVLTEADMQRGYQCDSCADAAEHGGRY